MTYQARLNQELTLYLMKYTWLYWQKKFHQKHNLYYLIKDDKTKKNRRVCNGSPHITGSITLVETYATDNLDEVVSKGLWAAAAINNSIVVGANTTNEFVEVGAPKAPNFRYYKQSFS